MLMHLIEISLIGVADLNSPKERGGGEQSISTSIVAYASLLPCKPIPALDLLRRLPIFIFLVPVNHCPYLVCILSVGQTGGGGVH